MAVPAPGHRGRFSLLASAQAFLKDMIGEADL